ncbi:MAG TPA: MBL fold metallo-hydrolase [Verrucomicrobiae bacterium]|nr:MBL fold metallo-hydrolase [Verrucomicrobiae bacterium]
MNLEDHLGDVLRKARAMIGVPPGSAATAAGLSETDYSNLEDSGTVPQTVRYAPLAEALRLNPVKLEKLARGWMPAPKDLGLWRELRQLSTTESGNTVHAYLVWDEVTREAAVFDTGWNAVEMLKIIAAEQLNLRHVFITHTHDDHMAGLQEIRDAFPKSILHTDARSAPPQHKNRRNDCIHLGSLRITNRETPGHAEDGVTYIVGNWPEDAPHVAIVGDAIFAGSMGGAPEHGDLAKSKVREQILSLPLDTLLCPGHGPLTTVAEEKENNPFF